MFVSAIANALGVDVPALPVAVTAPQFMEQNATIDAIFALAFGVLTHVSPTPPIVGGARLIKFLSEDLESITGGRLLLEKDMGRAAEAISATSKRRGLRLASRDRWLPQPHFPHNARIYIS